MKCESCKENTATLRVMITSVTDAVLLDGAFYCVECFPHKEHYSLPTQYRTAPLEPELARPSGLSDLGVTAYNTIIKILRKHNLLSTGGCTAFYSPQQWKARGEAYGQNSELVVVYDGGDLKYAFSMDYAEPGYKIYNEMQAALKRIGLRFEECRCWHAAIYKD